MKKLIPLFLLVILVFVTCQNASALTINVIPQKQEFGPNEWIKVDLAIQGYVGGDIKWVAHRPDNSVISGTVLQQVKAGKTMHQIIRDAYDSEFGPWSIDYQYGGINYTTHFNVGSLNLAVFMDKATYYEPNIMNINITSSYYDPYARSAKSYFLNFYDRDGNRALGSPEIEIKADRPSVSYHYQMLLLAKYNPPGLYKLKVQYFNSVVEIPFLLGNIQKLMEVSVQSKAATYYPGDDVMLDLLVTRVTQSTGVITITDPSGNTTSIQFPVSHAYSKLSIKDITKKIGTYKFNVQYAGVKNTGTFNVVANINELPKIDLDLYLNKWNYRKCEIVEARVYTSDIIAKSITSWTTDPQGTTHGLITIPVSLNDVIIPHKITKNDQVGEWQFYVNYGGVKRSSTFYVGGEIEEDSELLNSDQFIVPKYPSSINSSFNSPTGIAIDSDNNIYVADSGNSQIKKFDSKGNLLFTLGTLGSSKGQFIHPLGVFVNEKYIYVLDTGNSRIQIFDKNGKFVHSWGTRGDQTGMFHTPVSMSSDKYGNLFVADSEQNVIQIFDTLGNYKDEIYPVLADGKEIGNKGVKAITFDSDNNFYIISTNNKILKYSSIGNFINSYGSNGTEDGRFNQPSAIVVDANNYFYIADSGAHLIQKFDPNGNFIFSWGSNIGEDEFDAPAGLAIDKLHNFYVVDKNQNTIQKFVMDNPGGMVVLPNWIKKNAIWWSEGALDKSDFALVVKYIIKQGLIQTPPTPVRDLISEDPSSKEDQLKKDMQLWSLGKIDRIPQATAKDSVTIPEWLKKNVQLWSTDKIDDQTFFSSIEYLLSTEIMKI